MGAGPVTVPGPETDDRVGRADGAHRFGSVIEAYGPRLVRFLHARLGNRTDAQDLSQEAYFRLCRVREPELIREPEHYLMRIAINLANEFMLRRRDQPTHVELDAAELDLDSGAEPTFLETLETRSQVEKLEAIIAELPPLYQAVLLLRKRDGYSHEEIAERLSISPHTVHKYLSRALLKCRSLWLERHHD